MHGSRPLLLLCTLVACDPVEDQRGDAPSPSARATVTAKKIDDVWVFVGEPPRQRSDVKVISHDSLQGGLAKVQGGCLTIDGEVVVFWPDQIDTAEQIVEATLQAPPQHVSLPGGGGLHDAPQVVAEHCKVTSVRFAGRDAP